MKVSIIIPTYNVEPYIIKCLQSVASQTYRGDMECVIVDDCGADSSIPLVENFIKEYVGSVSFKIVHRKKNGGLSAARNSGVEVATGDYIYFLDSDDYIEPYTIEKLVETAAKYPEAEVIQAGIKDTNGCITFDARNSCYDDVITDRNTLQYYLMMPNGLPVSSWNKLIKTEFLVENNITFMEGVIHEDVDYIYKIAEKITALAICRYNTYIYRTQREGSILNTTNSDKSTVSRLRIYNSILDTVTADNRKVITQSLFLRLMYVLLSPVSKNELHIQFNTLCGRVSNEAIGFDRLLMKTYFSLPRMLRNKFYNVFNKHFSKR